MSRRQQRRELKTIAEGLHRIGDNLQDISRAGRLRLRSPDRVAVAYETIRAGATLFATAAAMLRAGKPSAEERTLADVL